MKKILFSILLLCLTIIITSSDSISNEGIIECINSTANSDIIQKSKDCSLYELSYFSLESERLQYTPTTEHSLNNIELTDEQKEYIKKYSDIIVCDGVISDISLYIITKRIDLIPSNIVALFRDYGWSVVVVDYELESKEWGTYNTNFTALTDTKNKTIWIENTNNALANSTCHEFGHFLDYISNMISYTDLFRGMYEKEKLNFVDSTRDVNDYAIQSNTEYFASVFSEYCINNNSCKSCVPMTYSYINAMIDNLN